MLPPAPGLFSTTTCWPHISESRAPRMRPMASMPPPGVNGTMSFTTRFGQSPCPNTVPGATAGTRVEAAAKRSRGRRASMLSRLDFDPGGLDDLTPLLGFRPQPRVELFRRRRHDLDADLCQPLLDRVLGEDRDCVGIDSPDNLDWRLGRNEERIPRRDVEAGERVRNR